MATDPVTPAESPPRHLRLGGVPVFVYHGLTSSAETEMPLRERKYWVSMSKFQGHLNEIQAEGYRVTLLRELWNPTDTLNSEKPVVVLTFDDGRTSDYQVAYPLLLEAGVRADFFVNTATISKPGFLNWQHIAEMQRAGMSFQSHGHDHVDLSRLPLHALEWQLGNSKHLLEDRLGCAVDFLAVPYGLLDRRVVEVALQVGYRAVCTSWSWPARPGVRTVNRIAVYRHTTLREFQRLLLGSPVCYAARTARTVFLYLPKHLLLRFWPNRLGVRILEEQT